MGLSDTSAERRPFGVMFRDLSALPPFRHASIRKIARGCPHLSGACRQHYPALRQLRLAHLIEAERLAEAGWDMTVLTETFRLRGDLLMLTDDCLGAEASFRAALAVAQRQNAKLWELRSTTSLARFPRDQDNRAEAHDLLGPIYHWFTEGFDAPDWRTRRRCWMSWLESGDSNRPGLSPSTSRQTRRRKIATSKAGGKGNPRRQP
jgi:hypothetical protein